MKQTQDLRVQGYVPLMTPRTMQAELPITPKASETVDESREIIQRILTKKDKRLLVLVGPCSIHSERAALEYAEKLHEISEKVQETL